MRHGDISDKLQGFLVHGESALKFDGDMVILNISNMRQGFFVSSTNATQYFGESHLRP